MQQYNWVMTHGDPGCYKTNIWIYHLHFNINNQTAENINWAVDQTTFKVLLHPRVPPWPLGRTLCLDWTWNLSLEMCRGCQSTVATSLNLKVKLSFANFQIYSRGKIARNDFKFLKSLGKFFNYLNLKRNNCSKWNFNME